MEQKRRGRPPGTGKKKEVEVQLNTTITTEPKKRGKKQQKNYILYFLIWLWRVKLKELQQKS